MAQPALGWLGRGVWPSHDCGLAADQPSGIADEWWFTIFHTPFRFSYS